MTEETRTRSPSPPLRRTTWIDNIAARLARIGADPRDDEEMRQKKALLVLLAVLILPVSVIWGSLYLGFGSSAGIVPFVYFAISLGSLVVFARTRSFRLLLVVQLLDILLTTTLGQMSVGGFLPSGGVGLRGILAPLGALVFLEVRRAIRWFALFVLVFLLTGVAGEVLFRDADLPIGFTSTMLALNVIGAGAIVPGLERGHALHRNRSPSVRSRHGRPGGELQGISAARPSQSSTSASNGPASSSMATRFARSSGSTASTRPSCTRHRPAPSHASDASTTWPHRSHASAASVNPTAAA